MLIKKYTVKTISEAMNKIREEFGEDAYILDTRKVKKGGFFGIGGEKYLEVTVLSESEQRPKKANEYQKNEKKNDNIGTYSLKDIISNNRKELTQKDKSFDLKGYSKEENRNSQPDENIELLKLIEENRKLSSKMDKGAEEFYSQKKEAIYNSANSTGLINNLEINEADEFKLSELKKSVDKLNKKLERSNIYLQEFKEELYKNSYSKTFIDSIISEIEDITFNENWRKDENLKIRFEQKITDCIKQANFKDLKGKSCFYGSHWCWENHYFSKNCYKTY
jgi:flagellar biosynthesis protein FlhF